MPRTRPSSGLAALIGNNRTISPGPSRMDDFLAPGSSFPAPIESILAANSRARLWEQDRDRAYQQGLPYHWDPAMMRIRDKYRETVVDAGHSTLDRRTALKGIR